MDNVNIPYKISFMVETYEGDWTSEEIDQGLAGTPRREVQSAWYENTGMGQVEITDACRIAELEERNIS